MAKITRVEQPDVRAPSLTGVSQNINIQSGSFGQNVGAATASLGQNIESGAKGGS
jgi:hypothetical protein